jgi:hypothetical protein
MGSEGQGKGRVRGWSDGGGSCWDSQLAEGADDHGCSLGNHVQCSSLSPVALLLQEAAGRAHSHKEPLS